MIKAVIFDYGGVVIRTIPDDEYRKKAARALGVSFITFQKAALPLLRELELGGKEKDFWLKLTNFLQKPLPHNYDQIFVEPFLKNLVFYEDITSLVKKLKHQGIKTAVLSNNFETHERLIRQRGGYKNFDVVVLSNHVGIKKPDPKIYLLTAAKLKVKPDECLFIDNKKELLLPAQKLGMKTILARNPKQVAKDVSALMHI